jgi:hypothetical protein
MGTFPYAPGRLLQPPILVQFSSGPAPSQRPHAPSSIPFEPDAALNQLPGCQ